MTENVSRLIIGGGVVVYPTETIYGLGANALDDQAIMRVFQIKRRPLTKPIFLAISSFEMLEKVAEIGKEDLAILEKLLPGPVSVLLKKRSIVPDILTAGSSMVGIRFPDHEIALKIIDRAGPITSTSANRTGAPSPTTVSEVSKEIVARVDAVLDGGKCKYASPSTLLDLANRKILREGAGLDKVNMVLAEL
ncbi:MAG: L-threonylcarbamoyladenylate synthase [Methanotrichaceae archaeon]